MLRRWGFIGTRFFRWLNSDYVAREHKQIADWKKRNPQKCASYSRKATKQQRQKLPRRIADNLRSRLRLAIRNEQKSGSAVQDLGCSIAQLKQYLQNQFQVGMSWDNYGDWHIDHIKPLASFDLTDREQFLQANHYTNLQPLWAKDNLRKGHKC